MSEVKDALAIISLKHFIRQHWKYIETRTFVEGWHLDAIAEHLEAVSAGQIRRLIINIPPRHMKSLSCSVFWPAWDWLKNPWRQFLSASYAETLSIRDSVKCRRVIQSQRYKEIMAGTNSKFQLTSDQNAKQRFENTQGGHRLATSVGGALTGEGGDIILVDDPHNVVDGESEVKRLTTLQWWDEAMSTRLNDPKTGAFVVIMQRLHEGDLTGHILENDTDGNWDHLCLPAEYELENRCKSTISFTDPREEEGEPLWPERYGKKELKALKKEIGSVYAISGQLQQRPSPREGGMFTITNFILIDDYKEEWMQKEVRGWDKAGTQGGKGARTAGVKISKMKSGPYGYIVLDVVKGRWEAGERENMIKTVTRIDGHRCKVAIEKEGGSGGKESAENSVRNLTGYSVVTLPAIGPKTERAEPLATQVAIQNVAVLNRSWTADFLQEYGMFPSGKFKDQVDAGALAFNVLEKLGEKRKRAGTWGRAKVKVM